MSKEMAFAADSALADIIRLLPEAISVFDEAEIDYSCRGARSLADAGKEAGYQAEDLLTRLAEVKRAARPPRNWYELPLDALVRFLVNDHGGSIAVTIPALRDDIDHAAVVLSEIPADLRRIRNLFTYFVAELATHMLNEERDLFPFISELAGKVEGMTAPRMRISQRVLRELVEHETFRDRLRTLRELAERLPQCEAVQVLREDLRQFSREVHRHMHLENNVLYPRAIEVENSLRRGASATP